MRVAISGGIATTARKVDGGYLLKGQKMWVTSCWLPISSLCSRAPAKSESSRSSWSREKLQRPRHRQGHRQDGRVGHADLRARLRRLFRAGRPSPEPRPKATVRDTIYALNSLPKSASSPGRWRWAAPAARSKKRPAMPAKRQQFGKPIKSISSHSSQNSPKMATDLEAARRLVHYAAWLKDNDKPHHKEAAMAKLFASEARRRHLRQGGARAGVLWLQHGICGATPPARHPLHLDRRRHQRNS